METGFQHLAWRGLEVDHPETWELIRASPIGQDPEIALADRRYERLTLGWRWLQNEPNVRKLVEDARRKDGRKEVYALEAPVDGWKGVWEPIGHAGTRVHAGRYFAERHLWVEMALVWPGDRDLRVERHILDSLQPSDTTAAERLHQAMGLKVYVSRPFDLVAFEAICGQTVWTFADTASGARLPSLTVRRIALPGYWLRLPLGEWIRGQLAPRTRILREERGTHNRHEAVDVFSAHPGRLRDRLRRRRIGRHDRAWICPIENRLYHITLEREAEMVAPEGYKIECCRNEASESPRTGGHRRSA